MFTNSRIFSLSFRTLLQLSFLYCYGRASNRKKCHVAAARTIDLIHLRVVVVLVVRMKAADRYLSILPTAGN
jgi:hypothetical protein